MSNLIIINAGISNPPLTEASLEEFSKLCEIIYKNCDANDNMWQIGPNDCFEVEFRADDLEKLCSEFSQHVGTLEKLNREIRICLARGGGLDQKTMLIKKSNELIKENLIDGVWLCLCIGEVSESLEDFDAIRDRSKVEELDRANAIHHRLHESGWTISGKIQWYYDSPWIGDFEARHPQYGVVHGNPNKEVYFESETAFKHFLQHHPFQIFDSYAEDYYYYK